MTLDVWLQGASWIAFGILLGLALTYEKKSKEIRINKCKEHEEQEQQ